VAAAGGRPDITRHLAHQVTDHSHIARRSGTIQARSAASAATRSHQRSHAAATSATDNAAWLARSQVVDV